MKSLKSASSASPSSVTALESLESPFTATQLASHMGVRLTAPLEAAGVWRLRKALPGYTSLLDDASAALEADGGRLGITDVTPEVLLETKRHQHFLAAREVVARDVYQSIYQQRLQADDAGMAMLQKIARRIDALTEDDPTLPQRWKFLLDFLGTFRKGPAPKSATVVAPVAPAVAIGVVAKDGAAK